MTYFAWDLSKKRHVGRGRDEDRKKKKLSCVKLAICPDHPRRHRPLKFCLRCRVREVVIYFKFHENRSKGLRAVKVENLPFTLTWPMAYTTTACTTVYKPWWAVTTNTVYKIIISSSAITVSLPSFSYCFTCIVLHRSIKLISSFRYRSNVNYTLSLMLHVLLIVMPHDAFV